MFDIYVHQDRVGPSPGRVRWVVTVIRISDCRMQQHEGWDTPVGAQDVARTVKASLEFAGCQVELHGVGNHPSYDRPPVIEPPGQYDGLARLVAIDDYEGD